MTTAFVFPGQGSQHLGMGHDLAAAFPAARAVFDEVDDALGRKLSAVIWGESEADLTLTQNAQPALMAVSLAVMAVLETTLDFQLRRRAAFVAGHSLGEYSALAATNSLTLKDAARLLHLRGEAMQRAVPVGEGAMAALLGTDFDIASKLAAVAAEDEVCEAANDNAIGQVVISGHKTAVERAVALSKDYGVRRAMMLTVSAPFHCALMAPAAEVMAQALASVTIKPPSVPLIANVLASSISDPAEIRMRLIEQVTGAVRWRETMELMVATGVTTVVEAGAGKVLAGLARRASSELTTLNIVTPQDVDAFAKTLST
ncbi:MAG: ACP S-malonyltransferase [Chitinophagales bacterium]|nr:ACP S-malonyltransferase [Hyphomicrobiales bacterium]